MLDPGCAPCSVGMILRAMPVPGGISLFHLRREARTEKAKLVLRELEEMNNPTFKIYVVKRADGTCSYTGYQCPRVYTCIE